MPNINNFLQYCVNMGASDLHISSGCVPQMRVHGELRPLKFNKLSPKETLSLIGEILRPEQQQYFSKHLDLDFCYEAANIGSFRANIFKQRNGIDAVFRIIPTQIRSLEELGLPRIVKDLTHYHHGLILVTGSAGNGKSTTLAAMIDYINSKRKLHIVTIEDPIEFVHPKKVANISQREVKLHTENFASALRASLREDPDVILIGELRDLETISMAITAAVAGNAPTSVTSSGNSWAVTCNQSTAKITASIGSNMPAGVTLSANLGAPAGATSAGLKSLSTAAVDVVTGITKLNASGLTLSYQLDATSAAGVITSTTRVVTYTITGGV